MENENKLIKRDWFNFIKIMAMLIFGIFVVVTLRDIFKPDNSEIKQDIKTNEQMQESNKARVEANAQRNGSNDTSNEKDLENVENRGKKAHKRITRPIGKPKALEMEVMYDELLNRKEL